MSQSRLYVKYSAYSFEQETMHGTSCIIIITYNIWLFYIGANWELAIETPCIQKRIVLMATIIMNWVCNVCARTNDRLHLNGCKSSRSLETISRLLMDKRKNWENENCTQYMELHGTASKAPTCIVAFVWSFSIDFSADALMRCNSRGSRLEVRVIIHFLTYIRKIEES